MQATLDGTAIQFGSPIYQLIPNCSGVGEVFAYNPPAPLSAGTHALNITAINTLNLESDYTQTFTIDGGQPKITLTDQNGNTITNDGYTNSTTISVTAAAQGVALLSAGINDSNQNPIVSANLTAGQQTVTFASPSLGQGAYTAVAVDTANLTTNFPFTVETQPPTITATDNAGSSLGQYAVTQNGPITFSAVQSLAPLTTLIIYENGQPIASSNTGSLTVSPTNQNGDWLIAQACDSAGNCAVPLTVGVFLTPATPPNPPTAPPPPTGNSQPPQPPYNGPQPPGPSPVPCLTNPSSCTYPPYAPLFPGQPGGTTPNAQYRTAGDPNFMAGPVGSVTPGQLMSYTVQFEDVGSAPALGVYVIDALPQALDETTLQISNMYALTFDTNSIVISTASAIYAWHFDPATRVVTVFTGNAPTSGGGSFTLAANLRTASPPGTAIANQAIVYFPNAAVPADPTNTVLSAVPLPTQLTYNGASSGVYLSTISLSAKLTAGTTVPFLQPINFTFAQSTATVITDFTGTASTMATLSGKASTCTLTVSYPGDGLYYLPSSLSVPILVAAKPTQLQAPYAVAYATSNVQLTLSFTDNQGQPLQHQGDTPKTVYLQALSSGTSTSSATATTLATALLSGTTVSFTFTPPKPFTQFTNLQASFLGDSRYAAALSTGALQLLDPLLPTVALRPVQSSTGPFFGSTTLNISYAVHDTLDPAPTSTAYLMQQGPQPPIPVTNGSTVAVSSLSPGSWLLTVSAKDWAGNQISTTTMAFQVLASTSAPVTALVAGTPSIGDDPIFISTHTPLSLLASPGQQGTNVTQTFIGIDGSAFSVYSGTIAALSAGTHIFSFYSKDLAGDIEPTETDTVDVDTTPPHTSLLVNGGVAASTAVVVNSTQTIAFSATDAESGVAETFYSLDGDSVTAFSTPFTLSIGTHTLTYFSQDFVGNVEAGNVARVMVKTVLDVLPPRTSFSVGPPNVSSGTMTYATDASTLSLTAVDDAQIVGDGEGVGVAEIFISIDTTTFSVYSGSFSLVSEGAHTVSFYSVDLDSHVEVAHSSSVAVDLTPPITTLQVFGSSTTNVARTVVISSAAPIALSAMDPLSSGVASGVAATYYVIDVNPFSPACEATPLDPTQPNGTCANEVYDSSFTLAVGTHTVYYFSDDNVGNQELVNIASFTITNVDVLPPRTSLAYGAPNVAASTYTFISTTTPFSLAAVDDAQTVGDGLGVGVASTYVSIDSAPYSVYVSSLSIGTAGPHTIQFYSADKVGNTEIAHSSGVYVEATPPSLAFTPAAGSTVTVSTPTLAIVYSAPAGVSTASVRFLLDGVSVATQSVVTASSATFVPSYALSQGTHTLSASVADALGNVAAGTSTFFLDSNPPATALLVDGLTRSATSLLLVSTDTVGFVAVDTGSPVVQTLYALDASTPIVYASTFSVAVGTHSLAFHSVDKAGNVEATHTVALSVRPYDVTPPTLTLAPPIGSTVTIATPTLTAVYVDTGSAVNTTTLKFALDGVSVATRAVVAASSVTFVPTAALSQGTHTVTASVADLDGNVAYATSTFFLDSIPPVTSLQVDGLTRSATSLVMVTTDTIGFVAVDSGTGVAETLYTLDASSSVVYSTAFHASSGTHTLGYRSVDRAGNVEAAHAATLTVKLADTQPPTIALTPVNGSSDTTTSKPAFAAVYADTGTGINKASFQLVVDGVNVTTRAVVTSSSATYVPTAALSQGTHTATAQVADVAGTVVSTTSVFRVDTAPPVSTLLVDGIARSAASLVLTTTDTIAFSAVDPGGPGVGEVLYQLSPSTAAVAYASPFLLAVGTHTLVYHGVDVLGVAETPHTVALTVSPAANAIVLSLALSLSGSGSNETLDVSGSVQDAHTPTWIVSVAIGSDPASGYTTISTGTGNVSEEQGVGEGAILAIWSMNSLPSGNYTLKLSATDAFGNSASTYDIFQIEPGHVSLDRPAIAPATATFGLLAHYAFPNPSNHGASVDFRLQPGEADSVDLHVYNAAGRKILTTTIYNAALLDDHNGLGTQYTYDYVWGVGGVGTGVYTYVFVAHKSGQTDIVVTGRAAVIK